MVALAAMRERERTRNEEVRGRLCIRKCDDISNQCTNYETSYWMKKNMGAL